MNRIYQPLCVIIVSAFLTFIQGQVVAASPFKNEGYLVIEARKKLENTYRHDAHLMHSFFSGYQHAWLKPHNPLLDSVTPFKYPDGVDKIAFNNGRRVGNSEYYHSYNAKVEERLKVEAYVKKERIAQQERQRAFVEKREKKLVARYRESFNELNKTKSQLEFTNFQLERCLESSAQ